MAYRDAHSEILRMAREAWRMPPSQTLWEWAEANVQLTPKTGTFAPGPYRTWHTPHVREVMEAYQNPDTRTLVLLWAAQTGKTLTETICAAWTVANDPGNTLFVMPSEQMAKSFSSNRLQRVLEDTEDCAAHILHERGKWNKLEMELDNCVVALAGAGSATNLASRAIKYLFLDELDKYPVALKEEGSPAELAIERTKTFPNRRIFETSTVTTENGGIYQAFLNSNRHERACKCPHCKEFFIPMWKHMCFPSDGTDNERAEACYMECPNCGGHITEAQRREFALGGKWIKTEDGQEGVEGYRISELASGIGRPWHDLVRMWLKAVRLQKTGNSASMRAFVCSVLAEPWRVETDTLRASGEIIRYCDEYARMTFPSILEVNGLTVGIDTQDNRFYYVVRAWGGGEAMESWLLDYGEVDGFAELEKVIYAIYQDESGNAYRITSGFIDSQGHRTHEVYDWCRSVAAAAGVLPSRGERSLGGGQRFAYTGIDRTRKGRIVAGGLRLARINTTFFKDFLDDKLRVPVEELGAWHIFREVDQAYCDQMVSEYRDEDGVWVTRGKQTPNHYWDCEVLALAAAVAARMDRSVARRQAEQPQERHRAARW